MSLPDSLQRSTIQELLKDNPFNSLLYSTTRPIPSSIPRVPYVILFQHSLSFAKRITSSDAKNYVPYRTLCIRDIQSYSENDLTGGDILRKAWRSLVEFCDGRVLYIRLIQNTVLHNHENNLDNWEKLWLEKWKKNGVIIEFVWTFSKEGNENLENMTMKSRPIIYKKHLRNLKEFLSYIFGTLTKIPQISKDNIVYPIPIMFDSITPLIHLYGSNVIKSLIQYFKNPPLSILKGNAYYSPIIFPYLVETLSPLDHCVLEDSCDSVCLLQDGLLHVTRRSNKTTGMSDVDLGSAGSRLIKDVQSSLLNVNINVNKIKTENENKVSLFLTKNKGVAKPNESGRITRKYNISFQQDGYQDSFGVGTIKKYLNEYKKPIEGPRFYLDENDPEWDEINADEPDDDLDI